MVIAALENGGDKRGAASRSIFGEEEVELVVDAHHLGDSALHHVLEMRVKSERQENVRKG
jgi:hypothetical protein